MKRKKKKVTRQLHYEPRSNDPLFSYKEIATELGCTWQAVWQTEKRAFAKLRQHGVALRDLLRG